MTDAPRPISPNIKRFLDAHLPGSQGGHVLAVAENHRQRAYYRFLADHLDELQKSHRLGTLGAERCLFSNIFCWAYRDRCLPVAPGEETAYLATIAHYMAMQQKPAVLEAQLEAQAMDRGMAVVHFDMREGTIKQHFDRQAHATAKQMLKQAIRTILQQNPKLHHELRIDPEAAIELRYALNKLLDHGLATQILHRHADGYEQLYDFNEGYLFAEIEAEDLSRHPHHPEYQRWCDHIDAVIEAGKKLNMKEDALSAAVFSAMSHPACNGLTLNGLRHVVPGTVLLDEQGLQGTFARHLDSAGLLTTTAMLCDRKEAKLYVKPSEMAARMAQARCPVFAPPSLLILDEDKVLKTAELPLEQPFGSLESDLVSSRENYRPSHTAGAIYGTRFVAKMKRLAAQPEMAQALATLRNDSPWQR